MPRKVFTAGEVLTSADVNTYLMNQTVMTFAGTAARGSAIGSATEGMVTYLADSDTFEFWDGSAYQPFGGERAILTEALVIGGGGGGGSAIGGGGGAGGYRCNVVGELSGGSATAEASFYLTSGSYPIMVGAGGSTNTRGSDSQIATFYSVGGGSGAAFSAIRATTGGSGGGGSGGGDGDTGSNGVLGVPRQGRDGGNRSHVTGTDRRSGGGGGALANGANATTTVAGAGGAGISSSITGTAVTRGGGGGGTAAGGTNGTGGTGGGGNAGSAGAANTGGGGGGGASGGSGIVIFRVESSASVSFSGGVSHTTTTVDNKTAYRVTAAGPTDTVTIG